MLPATPTPDAPPRIVAVGFRRINKMLQELAPDVADRAVVEVLDVGFAEAAARIQTLQARQPVDVVVAAGSNGAYLRQHLDVPVVLVKVGGFDLMQALSQARRLADRIGLVTYEGMAPDLSRFDRLFDFDVAQRSYRTEDEARACVRELQQAGVGVVVGSGVAVDVAEQLGLPGLFLYSMDAVRAALEDAVEVARAARNYLDGLLPPFFKALVQHTAESNYSWHTPGHGGGVAYRKSPVGQAFHQFFGENTLRSDLSVSVPELGSLLDHTGPLAAAEARAARNFGADHTFFVINGTSTANKIVWHSMVARDDLVLVDRASGVVTVQKLTLVTDAGTIVDPDGARAQTEGAALWGLSMALHEGTEFVNGQVKDLNLDSYTPLRISDTPELDIQFVDSVEVPVGLGEPATTVVAPAIANAIFRAVGVRLRHIPITSAAVLKALAEQT